MAGTVERLEQMLCAWEDQWFAFNASIQIEAGLLLRYDISKSLQV